MANATKYPTLSELVYFQWATPTSPNPRLAAPITSSATTITFTSAPLDSSGVKVTEAFLMGIRTSTGYVETVLVPAGGLSADGLTATGCTRGIKLEGYDYTAAGSGLAVAHDADDAVFCNITAVLQSVMVQAIQGNVATGGSNFIIGTDAAGTVTISRSTGTGTYVGFLRWTSSYAQYSNDGTTWVNISDVSASDIVKVSANDTTAGYLNGKLVAGSNVSFTENNDGGNETLTIAFGTSSVTDHVVYTPALLTGGSAAESNTAIWDSVSDGSFRLTLDGTAYNVDGIDFTSITTMADVASTIQTALRTASGTTATVVWSTDHFVITSSNTTASSAITVLSTSTGTVGTDISGAGASTYMDSETGRGTVTDTYINPSADSGKLIALGADGTATSRLIYPSIARRFTAGEDITVSGNPIPVYISDGTGGRTAGRMYICDADDLTNQANKFYGFVKETVATGYPGYVYQGYVDGFTGLSAGAKVWLSTTKGVVTQTEPDPSNRHDAGRAIFEDTVFTLDKEIAKPYVIVPTFNLPAAPDSTADTQVNCGFRPARIRIVGRIEINDAAGGNNKVSFGEAIWSGTTPTFIQGQYLEVLPSAGTVVAVTDNTGPYTLSCTPNAGANLSRLEISVQSMDDTSVTFRLTNTTTVGTGSTNGQVVNLSVFLDGYTN